MRKIKQNLIDEPEYFKSLIGKNNPFIAEIGCNDGTDTARFIELFPEAEIICFEPEPRAIERFKLKKLPSQVKLHEFAISDKIGRSVFYQSGGTPDNIRLNWDYSGSLRKPLAHLEMSPWCKFETTIEVETQSLDSAMIQYPWEIDLIWMDVQGGEGAVIKGARETLKRVRYLYTEFDHWKKPLYDNSLNLEATISAMGSGWVPLAVCGSNNLLLRNLAY